MAKQQLDMFCPVPPRILDSDTSSMAADSVAPHTSALRAKVYAVICGAGGHGATCDEIEAVTGLRHQTASARVNELHNGGFIVDSDQRRKTRSNRKAIVWIAKEST